MKLNQLFSDGAVFQRRMPIPVFGSAAPNSILSVQIAGNTFFTGAGLDGTFLIRLPAMEAGGPYTLVVSDKKNGDTVEVKDILVGEVFLASGQSNMEFMLMDGRVQKEEFLHEHAGKPSVRMFTVSKRASTAPENDVMGSWIRTDGPKDITKKMSAVALWFALRLHEKLGVPVGILASCWGGTIAEAWTSRNTLMRNPDYVDHLLEYEKVVTRPERWENEVLAPGDSVINAANGIPFEKLCKPDPGNTGILQNWHLAEMDDSSWTDFVIPGSWREKNLCGNGIVWIRKTVEIPESWAGKNLELHLGGIDKQDITYFNGQEVGRSGKDFEAQYWSQLRNYSVPGCLVRAGRNVIAIRAFSFIFDGSFNDEMEDYYLCLADDKSEQIALHGPVKFHIENDFGVVAFVDSRDPLHRNGPNDANTPSILFDSMIRPMIPYALRGAIWYQGESNAHSPDTAKCYQRLIKDLITDWRFYWGQGDFPFYQVQLANFGEMLPYTEEEAWCWIRKSQIGVTKELPNVGLITAIDIGEAKDIHPKDKRSVGFRLADLALRDTFHLTDVPESCPVARDMRIEGNAVRVSFDNADKGLTLRDAEETGFYIAGEKTNMEEMKFRPAQARVEGNSVVLFAEDVPSPRHVRYAWANNPQYVTLFNADGLPACAFEF